MHLNLQRTNKEELLSFCNKLTKKNVINNSNNDTTTTTTTTNNNNNANFNVHAIK